MKLKGKKVLVTGADGFIGSHLVERLVEEGCHVRAFCFYNSFNSWGWIDSFSQEMKERIDVQTGDVRDAHGIRNAMEGVDVVFHLAALIGIPFSYTSPDTYVDTNIKGTLNILQAGRQLGTPRILVTSTSEVYGTAKYVPIDEAHPRQGQSPYSATKIAADYLAESFFRSFDLPVVIVRPFNTYGPRQSARAVIPTIISQILKERKKIILGDINPVRDLVYVKDTVEAFLAIARSERINGEDFNIASGAGISIGELARRIMHLMDRKVKIVKDGARLRPEKSEVFRLIGSNKKLCKLTAWKQAYSLEQGLQETIEWFLETKNLRSYKTDLYNV